MKLLKFTDRETIDALKGGEVLSFPTETVFGLGVRYDDEKAFEKLVNVKRRPPEKPFTLMCASANDVEKYAFEEVVCNLRENMNETVDNYVQKKILDSSNYWNLNDSKKMVIHRARWIKSYTISKK